MDQETVADDITPFLEIMTQELKLLHRKGNWLQTSYTREDFRQEAKLIVLEALQTHDPLKGPLQAHIRMTLRRRLIDLLRKQLKKTSLHTYYEYAHSKFVRSTDDSSYQNTITIEYYDRDETMTRHQKKETFCDANPETFIIRETLSILRHAMQRLPERELTILSGIVDEGKHYKDLAADLNLSLVRITQLCAQARLRLKVYLALS